MKPLVDLKQEWDLIFTDIFISNRVYLFQHRQYSHIEIKISLLSLNQTPDELEQVAWINLNCIVV